MLEGAFNTDHHCVPGALYIYIHLHKVRDKYLGFISLENGKEGTNRKCLTWEEYTRFSKDLNLEKYSEGLDAWVNKVVIDIDKEE